MAHLSLRRMTQLPSLSRFAHMLQARSFTFQPEEIGVAEGIRAAIAVSVLIYVGQVVNQPLFSWAAFGAFWTCLADPGGPRIVRLHTMGGFALAGTILAAVTSYVGTFGLTIAAPILFVLVFLCGLSRFLGAEETQAGVLASVVAVVAIEYPNPPEQVLALAGLFFLGSVFALILCLLIWRIHPHAPARRAIGAVFRDLGNMATDLRIAALTSASGMGWTPFSSEHRMAVRSVIERARTTVNRVVVGRDDARVRRSLGSIIDAGDRIFTGLIALEHDLDARRGEVDAATLSNLLKQITDVSSELGREAMQTDPDWKALRTRAETLTLKGKAASDLTARVAETWAQAILELVDGWGKPAHIGPASSPSSPPNPTTGSRSVIIRHALRVAVVVLIAYLTTSILNLAYGYWATMAVVVVMQPYVAATWPRMLERIIGSVVGGLVAGTLLMVLHSPFELLVAIFPLAGVTIAFRSVSYTVFVLFLTPLFVLVADLLAPGHGGAIAFDRSFNNVLGCVLSLIGGLVLWPDPAPSSFRESMVAAVDANMRYATLAIHQAASFEEIESARRKAGIASTATELAMRRASIEGQYRRKHLGEAAELLAGLRRLAGSATAVWLQADLSDAAARANRAEQYDALRLHLVALVEGRSSELDLCPPTAPQDNLEGAIANVVELSRLYAIAAGLHLPRVASPASHSSELMDEG